MNFPISPRRLAVLAGIALMSPAFALVNIDYVSVSHGGNAADPVTGSLYGAVAYAYRIGKYEVTNAQYSEFLNAVDPTGANAYGIYNINMGSNARGGISFTAGAANGSKYTIRTNMGDKPVVYVSWFSAARFTNWLHNGQGSGSTETGAYTMSLGSAVTRNAGATVWIPSENEWYKAAYFDPTLGAGGGDNYWIYATRSNTAPTFGTANATGSVSNPGANVVNFASGADWNNQNGNVTTVGSAGADNYFGTSDMSGNVSEWIEAIQGTSNRYIRGGAWSSGSTTQLSSSERPSSTPSNVNLNLGFRVASIPAQAMAQALSFAIDANDNPVLQWQAEAGRRYSILYSTDLKKFTPIAKGFPFGGAQIPGLQFKDLEIFSDTTPRAFYKIEEIPASTPDSVTELDAFFTANGGKAGFQNNQVMAMETLLFALDEIEAGQLVEARARVDAMLAAYPLSTPGWNAGYGYRGLNMGNPVGYYGIRMLDQILTLGNPSRSKKGKLRMTAVVAPSAVVTRPTLPNFTPETLNLNIAPEIIAEDARRLHLVTRLFRRWLQAITGGLEVELQVHVMNEGTIVNFTDNPGSFGSYPDEQAMVNSVPASIANTTDLWWVIAPSGVPGDGTGYGKDFISGGVRFLNPTGLPIIICDDAWLTRKPVHLGSGAYSETELQMYLPMWFQHEIMHVFFQKWSKFGLEAQSHQWFDRNTWPADFVGVYEADYYAEALTKRILNDSLSVADALQVPDYADMAVFPVAKLLGNYRRNPVENGFHEVTISLNGGNLRWNNAAGISWGLEIIGSELWSVPNSPYGAQRYRVKIDGDGNVIEIAGPDIYKRNDNPQP